VDRQRGNESGIALVGGGGHALVVEHVARVRGMHVRGFFDDDAGAPCGRKTGLKHLGTLQDAARAACPLILAMGDLATRRRTLSVLGTREFAGVWWCDAAVVDAASACMGIGVFLGVQSVVQAWARVGAHAIINTGAIVEHECEVGENAHVAPGAVLGGRVRVGSDTLVGIGARVLPGVVIGRGCVVGAGAVVTRDVADGARVAGVPARVINGR
jgi:sugar O-acyltransferase (sialic acid O-acetyltransferase NeuD family)